MSAESVNYLGCSIDQSLSGEVIASKVVKKSNAKIKFLFRISRCLNLETKRLLASTLVQCHFDYACSAWYPGLSERLKKSLQITQNKLVRFVQGKNLRAHVGYTEIKQLGWLPVPGRVTQINLNHMYKITNDLAPNYLSSDMIRTSDIHGHNTRKSLFSYLVPRVNSHGKKSFKYNAIKQWNALPLNVKTANSLEAFKIKAKLHIHAEYVKKEKSDFIFY